MHELFCNVQGLDGLELVLRIWDIYLLKGEAILYCVALAIIRQKALKLSNAPMYEWLEHFRSLKKLRIPEHSKFVRVQADEGA